MNRIEVKNMIEKLEREQADKKELEEFEMLQNEIKQTSTGDPKRNVKRPPL